MAPIIDNLPFEHVVLWDNSEQEDFKVWGRYRAAAEARGDVVAWIDDDVVFKDWDALLAAYEPGTFLSNNAHGPNHGGYNDLALQAAGALCDGPLIVETWQHWFDVYPFYGNLFARKLDHEVYEITGGVITTFRDALLLEADFIFGVLCPRWTQVDLPYERLYADDNTRLCRQPWQEDLKLHMTQLARAIRDDLR